MFPSILLASVWMMNWEAAVEKTNSVCLILMVEMEPYLWLHILPMGLPRLSTNMMSISFSMAVVMASEEMMAPFDMVMDLILSGWKVCVLSLICMRKLPFWILMEAPGVWITMFIG